MKLVMRRNRRPSAMCRKCKGMVMKRVQRGFSLIELMVAMVIGLVLMTGVVQMFLSSKQVFSTQQGISRVQKQAA